MDTHKALFGQLGLDGVGEIQTWGFLRYWGCRRELPPLAYLLRLPTAASFSYARPAKLPDLAGIGDLRRLEAEQSGVFRHNDPLQWIQEKGKEREGGGAAGHMRFIALLR